MDPVDGIVVVLVIIFYFLPTLIGAFRGHANIGPIFVVNLLLGWIVIGWIVALAWSVSAQRKPAKGEASD